MLEERFDITGDDARENIPFYIFSASRGKPNNAVARGNLMAQ